jgi:hypothetical protein
MAESAVDPDLLAVDLDTLHGVCFISSMHASGKAFLERNSGLREDFKGRYLEIMSGLDAMEKLINESGVRPGIR